MRREAMPTTVRQALHAAALEPFGVVPWGEVPEPSGPGVYAVALTSVTDSLAEAVSEAPLYEEAIDRWLVVRPELRWPAAGPRCRSWRIGSPPSGFPMR